MLPAPIAIHTDGTVSCGATLWRYRGRVQLTVIVKSVFAFAPDDVAARAGPGEIVAEDRQLGGNPMRSVEIAADLAPLLARCDVLFTGHAHPPGGQPAPASSVRLGISRDGVMLLDKVIHVFGDRGPSGAPEPFARMPIVYERAIGGPGEPNPVGTESPNLVEPADARRPAGFGPISRFWSARKRLLDKIDKRALEDPIAEIPEAMPWHYFQAAPPDQQIEHLRGGEWLVLDGLHPTRPRVQTCLPAARGAARVVVRRAGAAPAEQAIDLACDTLAIDGDRQTFSLTWRGRYEVADGEAALPSLLVVAALDAPGVPVDWARLVATAPAAQQPVALQAKPQAAGEGTMAMRPEQAAAVVQRAALPFAAGAPGAPASRASAEATPWGAELVRPAPVAAAGETTIGPRAGGGRSDVGEGTLGLRSDQHAALGQRPAAPFPLAPTGSGATPALIPGAPWSDVRATAAPLPAGQGEATLAFGALRPEAVAPPPVASPPMQPPPVMPSAAAPPPIALAAPPPATVAPSPAARPVVAPPVEASPVAPSPAAPSPADVALPARPKKPPPPRGPEALAGKLRAAGVADDSVAALLRAMRPPPPPPPDEE